jgi:hypothetical protein
MGGGAVVGSGGQTADAATTDAGDGASAADAPADADDTDAPRDTGAASDTNAPPDVGRADTPADATMDAPADMRADAPADAPPDVPTLPEAGTDTPANPDAPTNTDGGAADRGVVAGSPGLCDPSGFCWVHPLPTGNDLLAILARSATDLWIAGWYNTLLHWNGNTWTRFQVTALRMSGLAAEPSGAVWVVGDGGLAARFDGTRFEITDTGTQVNLVAVAAIADNQVYAVGATGTVLLWNGARWSPVTGLRIPIPDSADTRAETRDLYSVWGANPDDVWIGGAGVLWHKVGGDWSMVHVGSRSFSAISATSASNVWFACGDGVVMQWNGTTLSAKHANAVFGATAIAVISDTDVWASYYQGVEHWDGQAWTKVSLTWSLASMSGPVGGEIWAAGERGSIMRWNGRTWAPGPAAAAGQNAANQLRFGVYALWASRADDVWLTSVGYLYHWDGSAITRVTARAGTRDINAFWGTAPNNVWAFGKGGEVGHWDGVSWTLAGNTGTQEFLAAWGSSASDIWTVGLYGAYHYDGVAWSLENAGAENTALQSVYPAGPTLAWAGGFNDLLLRWDGQRWTRETSIPSSNFTGGFQFIWGSGPSDVWAFGERAYHYDGQSWTPDPNGRIARRGWGSGPRDFWGASGNTVFHYDGSGWTNFPVDTSLSPLAIGGVAPGDVFVGGPGGFLRRMPR